MQALNVHINRHNYTCEQRLGKISHIATSQGSYSHILMTGGSEWFFGSEILAKGNFLGL